MDFRNPLKTRNLQRFLEVSNWVQGLDLNQRPSGYEPDELPGCSTLQQREVEKNITAAFLSTGFLRPGSCYCICGSASGRQSTAPNRLPPSKV